MGASFSDPENSCELRCCCCCKQKSCWLHCCWCCSPIPCPYLRCFLCTCPSRKDAEFQEKPSISDKAILTEPVRSPTPVQIIPKSSTPLPPISIPIVHASPPSPSPSPSPSFPSIPQSPKLEPVSSPMLWLSDCSVDSSDQSSLLKGYEREPLVTLEEALAQVKHEILKCDEQIEEAKKNCTDPLKLRRPILPSERSMSKDQSAAIYLYSMRKYKQNVYYILKAALTVELVPLCNMEIWQAIPYDLDHEDLLKPSMVELFTGFGSCTPMRDLARIFASGQYSSERKVPVILIGYNGVRAYDISDYIADSHQEIFLPHGINPKRKDWTKDRNGDYIAHLSYEPEQMHVQVIGDITQESTRPTTPIPTPRLDVIAIPLPMTPRFGHFTCAARGNIDSSSMCLLLCCFDNDTFK